MSGSRRLVSEGAFQRLNVLYEYVIHDLDFKISNLIASDDPRLQNDWANMAHRFRRKSQANSMKPSIIWRRIFA